VCSISTQMDRMLRGAGHQLAGIELLEGEFDEVKG
jgi:hypothetical protein